MRKSKYPSLGILDAINRLVSGGGPDFFEGLCRELKCEIPSEKRTLSAQLYRLKNKEFINRSRNGLILTLRGLAEINSRKVERIKIEEKRKDGLWRVVVFDVPETKKLSRNILRKKLREFNCYLLQKSVFITPYICEDEIKSVAELLGIKSNISVIIAKSLGDAEERIEKYFST